MDTTQKRELLNHLAAMRNAYLARVQRWRGAFGDEEDVVQDAFVRATAGAHGLRDDKLVTEWFFRALQSAYVDHRRRTDARRRLLVDVAREVAVSRQVLPYAPELGCVSLRYCLSTLRSDYKTALELVHLKGCSLAEFAMHARITPNNARVRLHRARIALARLSRACCHAADRDAAAPKWKPDLNSESGQVLLAVDGKRKRSPLASTSAASRARRTARFPK